VSAVPLREVERRIEKLQDHLRAARPPLDGALLIQNVDVYYLAGTFQSSHLIVPARGKPRLLVRRVLERARDDSPLQDVLPMTSLRDLPGHLRDLCGDPPWRLGLELDVLPVRQYRHYREILGEKVEAADVSATLLEIRAVKSEWEIERIRRASRVIARVFAEIPELLEGDRSTYELQSLFELRARNLGHPGVIRLRGLNLDCPVGYVVSGPSGAAPGHSIFPIGGRGTDPCSPAGGDFEKVRPDTPIIFDFLGCIDGYYADQSRMAVKGTLPAGAEEIYGHMQEVLRFCEENLGAGAVPSEIYRRALDLVESRGLSRGFQGPPGHAAGFLGHGIGLEVNELPVLAPKFHRPLEEGTVIAIEPKFTHPDWGVIGIENTYAVRRDRLENLTPISEAVIEG